MQQTFKSGQEITRACLACHTEAARQVMKTKHWTWEALNPNTNQKLGKKTLVVPAPATNRTHCVLWSDWASQVRVEISHSIRLDTNYYAYPGAWIGNRPGLFTGSSLIMRFADVDGSHIDVYQAPTHMTDESGQTYPYTVNTLLDRALGSEEVTTVCSPPTCTSMTRLLTAPMQSLVRPGRVVYRSCRPVKCCRGLMVATIRHLAS